MRDLIEASKSETLYTMDISFPDDKNECLVVCHSRSIAHNGGSHRSTITWQQAEQIMTIIGCAVAATKP